MPLLSVPAFIFCMFLWDFGSFDGIGSIYVLLFMISFFSIGSNLCGIMFSAIFLRKIKLVLAAVVIFIANWCLSWYLSLFLLPFLIRIFAGNDLKLMEKAPIISFYVANVTSFLLFWGIVTFDNIYTKRYFKKLLTRDSDIILDRIHNMGVGNAVFYVNKYKRKDPALYNSLIAKFEEAKIGFLFEAGGNAIRALEDWLWQKRVKYAKLIGKWLSTPKNIIILLTALLLGVSALCLWRFGLIPYGGEGDGDNVIREVKIGSFTDPRDEREYRTVQIYNLTWMDENLNFETGTSWCYDDADSNCQKYGRLYDRATAMEACPSGWHLPGEKEWLSLMYAENHAREIFESKAGRNKRRGKSGSDTVYLGFSALPGGTRYYNGGRYHGIGEICRWWSAKELKDAGKVPYHYTDRLGDHGGYILVPASTQFKEDGLSVRCVRGFDDTDMDFLLGVND
jgi:uncharacterized protein (TIGR02145 family)